MTIKIRKLIKSDIETCIRLFHDTVHTINLKDYSPDQIAVWAPDFIDANSDRWQSLITNISLVAELNNELVGFIDMTDSGYLDRLFVHKDYQGKGIANALFRELERIAKDQSITEISTEASITAKPFFEANNFEICKEQKKLFNGVQFVNYVMKKHLHE